MDLFIQTSATMYPTWVMGFGMAGRVVHTEVYEAHRRPAVVEPSRRDGLRQATNAGVRTIISVPTADGVVEFGSTTVMPHNGHRAYAEAHGRGRRMAACESADPAKAPKHAEDAKSPDVARRRGRRPPRASRRAYAVAERVWIKRVAFILVTATVRPRTASA